MHSFVQRYRQSGSKIDAGMSYALVGVNFAIRFANMCANRNVTNTSAVEYTAMGRAINTVQGASLLISFIQQTEKLKKWHRNPVRIPTIESVPIPARVMRMIGGSVAAATSVRRLHDKRLNSLGKLPSVISLVGASHIVISSGIELWTRREAVVMQARLAKDVATFCSKNLASHLGIKTYPTTDPDMMRSLIAEMLRAGYDAHDFDSQLSALLDGIR